jgi:hypothetical protein
MGARWPAVDTVDLRGWSEARENNVKAQRLEAILACAMALASTAVKADFRGALEAYDSRQFRPIMPGTN